MCERADKCVPSTGRVLVTYYVSSDTAPHIESNRRWNADKLYLVHGWRVLCACAVRARRVLVECREVSSVYSTRRIPTPCTVLSECTRRYTLQVHVHRLSHAYVAYATIQRRRTPWRRGGALERPKFCVALDQPRYSRGGRSDDSARRNAALPLPMRNASGRGVLRTRGAS